MGLIIHVDGGARGNPGPAGAGVVIRREDGTPVYEAAYFLGTQTNNTAEYQALIHALQRAATLPPEMITIHSDSELLVRQITGEYQVKSPKLAQLYEQVQFLLLKVPRWAIRHIKREQNVRADELANLAMDRRRNVVVVDVHADGASPPPAESEAPVAEPEERPAARHSAAKKHGGPAVRVTVVRQPATGHCPVGAFSDESFTVGATLPAGLCVHAAHALLPTVLAVLSTDPGELAAVPTMTVRCAHPGCRAEFQVSPVHSSNGHPRRKDR